MKVMYILNQKMLKKNPRIMFTFPPENHNSILAQDSK